MFKLNLPLGVRDSHLESFCTIADLDDGKIIPNT